MKKVIAEKIVVMNNLCDGISRRKDKKSRIPETKNLLTDADSRTNTILERLRDLSLKIIKN